MSYCIQFSTTRSIGSKVIRWFTWSPYSHVDLVLPDGRLLGATPGGVSIRLPQYDRIARRARFDIPGMDWEKLAHVLKAQIGKPYDWGALVGLAFRSGRWHDPDRWFCSELIYWGCERAGTPLLRQHKQKMHRITPRDLLLSPALERLEDYRYGL